MKNLGKKENRVNTPETRRLTVTAAAQALGVSRTHLSLVLHGHRASKSLTARYHALKQRHS